MSFFQNLLGIIGTSFKFNKGNGSNTANEISSEFSGGESAIAVRDAAGAYIVGRGKDPNPANVNDWVTIGYLNGLGVAAAVKEVRFALPSGTDAGLTPFTESTAQIASTGYVVDAEVKITTAYNNTPTLAMRINGTPDAIMATTDNDPTQLNGFFSVHQDTANTSGGSQTFRATLSHSGAGTGEGVAIIRFVNVPLN